MRNNSEYLMNLIKENPTLPVRFFVSTDITDEYSYAFLQDYSCEVSNIYEIDERICDGENEAIEYLSDYYSDCEDYKDLNDEEYENKMKEILKEYPSYKAIVITVYEF